MIHSICPGCSFYCRDLDNLAKYLSITHKNQTPKEYDYKACDFKSYQKSDLDLHIKDNHWSYKPCKEFSTNSCEYNSECRYNHVKLKLN